jgi:uncharacterized protein (TIRG00374 family)
MSPAIRRQLKSAAKLALGLGIVAYLVYQAQAHQKFEEILYGPKNWPMLATSLLCVTTAIVLGFMRWYLLVRAVGLPFTLSDALRLGSLGFALNFVGPGGVGGDLFKSVALAREHRRRKTEAVATVIADRLIGLFALLIVTSTAIVATGLLFDSSASAALRTLATMTVMALATMAVFGALFMAPSRISEKAAQLFGRLPLVGGIVGSLFVSCQVMSRRPERLLPAIAMAIVGHLLLVLSFYTVAVALPFEHPTMSQHFCIVPLAETAGAIPATPGGLGTTETALAFLYKSVGYQFDVGMIVALGQRLVMMTLGVVAIGYFLTQRKQVDAALHEAEAKVAAENAA